MAQCSGSGCSKCSRTLDWSSLPGDGLEARIIAARCVYAANGDGSRREWQSARGPMRTATPSPNDTSELLERVLSIFSNVLTLIGGVNRTPSTEGSVLITRDGMPVGIPSSALWALPVSSVIEITSYTAPLCTEELPFSHIRLHGYNISSPPSWLTPGSQN
jgi:hypothetical protein